MAASVLIDSNVLLYAYDRAEPEKQKRAVAVLDRLVIFEEGVLTSQVLAEFFVNATRRLSCPLTLDEAYERVQSYVSAWTILPQTGQVVLDEVRGVRDHHLAYWDAQIWAVAKLNQIPAVFTEDLPGQSLIEGVRFVNPFAPEFDLEAWAGS